MLGDRSFLFLEEGRNFTCLPKLSDEFLEVVVSFAETPKNKLSLKKLFPEAAVLFMEAPKIICLSKSIYGGTRFIYRDSKKFHDSQNLFSEPLKICPISEADFLRGHLLLKLARPDKSC